MAEDRINEMFLQGMNKAFEKELEKGTPVEKLEKFIESDAFVETYKEILKEMSESMTKTIEEIMFEKVLEERAYTNEFVARTEQKWGKAFVASEALYICIMESAEHYIKYVAEKMKGKSNDRILIYNALLPIHARACQVYLEVMCLCKNGFADGAYARWRSLYELSVISDFIRKSKKTVAEAFIKAADTEDRYEWAREADCFKNYPKNRHITFSAIQKQCKLNTSEWREQYTISNQIVHASPQGTMYRLGYNVEEGTLVAGRTDYGFSMPMVQAAISLASITADVFTLFEHADSYSTMLAFNKWVDHINEYYNEVEDIFFSNEEKETSN